MARRLRLSRLLDVECCEIGSELSGLRVLPAAASRQLRPGVIVIRPAVGLGSIPFHKPLSRIFPLDPRAAPTAMPPKGKKKDAASAATKPAAAQPEQQPPNWPPFKPLIPPSDLSLQEVVPAQIVTVPNFWPSSLCKTYVSFLSSLPLITTPGKPKKGEAVRVNDRFQIQDPVFAKRLWEETALKDIVLGNVESEDGLRMTEEERRSFWGGEVVGLNPNIRIYRYSKGQFFDQHCKPLFDSAIHLTALRTHR